MSAERAVKVKTNWGVSGMVTESRSQGVAGVWVEFLTTPGAEVGFFVRLQNSNWQKRF